MDGLTYLPERHRMDRLRKIIAATPVPPGGILAPFTLGIPRIVSEVAPSFHATREREININRHRLQGFVLSHRREFEFVLLLDADVVVGPEILDRLMDAWKPGTTPCVNTKGGKTGHVIASCALISMEDYANIDYLKDAELCQCTKVPNPFYIDYEGGTET